MDLHLSTYAVHRTEAGSAIIIPCDDPFEPSTRVVAVVEEPKLLDLWIVAALKRIVRAAGRKRGK
jgi:hypothetical protein